MLEFVNTVTVVFRNGTWVRIKARLGLHLLLWLELKFVLWVVYDNVVLWYHEAPLYLLCWTVTLEYSVVQAQCCIRPPQCYIMPEQLCNSIQCSSSSKYSISLEGIGNSSKQCVFTVLHFVITVLCCDMRLFHCVTAIWNYDYYLCWTLIMLGFDITMLCCDNTIK